MASPSSAVKGPSLTFTLEQQGFYGSIKLNDVVIAGGAAQQNSLGNNPIPPLNEPMVGTPSTGISAAFTDDQQSSLTPRRAWNGFFLAIRNTVAAQTVNNGTLITLLAPSIDETQPVTVTFGQSLPANNQAPQTVTASVTSGFSVGDYILSWDAEPMTVVHYTHEAAR